MRVLISGFEAFGNYRLNPTEQLISALKNQEISYPATLRVEPILLPVTFEDSFHLLQGKIQSFNPDVVIALGLTKREAIELENIAKNLIDAEIGDNKGYAPKEKLINVRGADTYLSTLPLLGLERALKDADLPVKMSNSAGTFVCNYLFYRLMETNQDTFRLCGFIHVPLLPEQAKDQGSSLSITDQKRALSVILNYIDY